MPSGASDRDVTPDIVSKDVFVEVWLMSAVALDSWLFEMPETSRKLAVAMLHERQLPLAGTLQSTSPLRALRSRAYSSAKFDTG